MSYLDEGLNILFIIKMTFFDDRKKMSFRC